MSWKERKSSDPTCIVVVQRYTSGMTTSSTTSAHTAVPPPRKSNKSAEKLLRKAAIVRMESDTPWHVATDDALTWVEDANGNKVFTGVCHCIDARLIAAAPDLLEMCKR